MKSSTNGVDGATNLCPEFVENLKKGRKKKQQWEEIAKDFDVEELKKQRGKPDSKPAKLAASESRETSSKYSMRSRSKETISLTTDSTDNSCSSSLSATPRQEVKLRRSRRLQPIEEKTLEQSVCEDDEPPHFYQLKQREGSLQAVDEDGEEEEDIHPYGSAGSVQGSSASERQQTDEQPGEIFGNAAPRYSPEPAEACSSKQLRSMRFSAPARAEAFKHLSDLVSKNDVSQDQSGTARTGFNNPTRLFFESIGCTVMGFPPHLQATIKIQVSNLVHELEFQLASSGGTRPQTRSVACEFNQPLVF